MTSETEAGTHGDSSSFGGEFEAEERRMFGAPRGDASKESHSELYNSMNETEICYVSMTRTSYSAKR